jgi:hypothetical protein
MGLIGPPAATDKKDMAETTQQERRTPPRFGRNVERPRVEHARETVERTDHLLAELDELLVTR